jgi:hypothetical protein
MYHLCMFGTYSYLPGDAADNVAGVGGFNSSSNRKALNWTFDGEGARSLANI